MEGQRIALCKENHYTSQHQLRIQSWHSSLFLAFLSVNTLLPVSQDCCMDPFVCISKDL